MLKNKSIDYIFGMITGAPLMLAFWACTGNDLVANTGSIQEVKLVYELYELTEEEISIVEESAG